MLERIKLVNKNNNQKKNKTLSKINIIEYLIVNYAKLHFLTCVDGN
jgi:hypothetical protein